jgi:hypothetical protein
MPSMRYMAGIPYFPCAGNTKRLEDEAVYTYPIGTQQDGARYALHKKRIWDLSDERDL